MLADFEDLDDKYPHGELVDLILGLYMWLCLKLLESLFNYSHPYLHSNDYKKNVFEAILDVKGLSAYHLYISKDYYAKAHQNDDLTKFSLCYTCLLNSTISPMNFIILEYELLLSMKNDNLFAFCNDITHDIGYRSLTLNSVYVDGVTVNRRLDKLMQKTHNNIRV